MRIPRPRLSVVLSVALVVGALAPAGAFVEAGTDSAALPPLPGVSVTTDNVEHVGYLAEVGPSVSARVVEVDGRKRLYVSSIGRGLSIYDVTDPPNPELIGTLPIAGFQNEDIAVSDDGDVAVMAYGDTNGYTINFVIDTSDPASPRLASTTAGGDHTAECVTDDCSFLYGSEGNIYDLSDIDDPVTLDKTWITHAREQGANVSGFPHKVVLDAAGYVLTDSTPRVMLDVADPANPVVVTQSARFRPQDQLAYQHNSLRPFAEEYVPREEGDDDPALRAGELLLANGESNLVPQCDGAGGPFFTMDMRRWDEGREFTVLDTFRPLENGDYLDGNPAVNALGCSGHWFDWAPDGDDYLVPAAWFEHGVRFLKVEAATGAISEHGFFQPFNGSVGATYWIDDEYVYTTDYVRGIDILRFDRDAEPAGQDELDANWLAGLELPKLPQTAVEQTICRLAVEGSLN